MAITEDSVSVDLVDGCTVTVPLTWYPRLLHATTKQRQNWQICGGGCRFHHNTQEHRFVLQEIHKFPSTFTLPEAGLKNVFDIKAHP